jgi:two-component system, NtrC family, sensor histidine kinase HydH
MTLAADAAGLADVTGIQEKAEPRSFSLLRWFSVLSLLTILTTGTAMAWFLTRYLTDGMLMRDAEVTREFIESIVTTERGYSSTRQPSAWPSDTLDRFVRHLPTLPDVIGANLFSSDQTVLWSSEQSIVGRRFESNDELKEALGNKIVAEAGVVTDKAEHGWLKEATSRNAGQRFVEAYLPIRDETGERVIAVVEIYKLPTALFRSIDHGVRLVWASAAIMGLVLYGALFWIVRRADQIMHDQRERLVEAETLSVIGEMAAAVAHSIRNPLASIRSAAELAHEEDGPDLQQCLQSIMSQVDRLDGWIRELLVAARGGGVMVEQIDVHAIVRESLDGARADMQHREIVLTLDLAPLPLVRGTRAPLAHAIRSIVSNAIEAMPDGGHLRVETRLPQSGQVQIVIQDSGVGMPADVAQKVFRPLFTTKPNGVGLGLSLARRVVERHGGKIELTSAEGHGTWVILSLPAGA